ncbi:hypothetical protein AB0D94_22360 [Streptomyces sp. NPDC048255]|uniref:hypothetical protein n=1 Tax=Streptomyces sp. NPDC048255 TaxID=3154713 RepID=UPI003400DAE8
MASSCRSSAWRRCSPLVEPDDVLFTARVELSGQETMGHLHERINTVTRGIALQAGVGPGVALEVLVGKRQELALHNAHIDGLTRLLRDTVGHLSASSTSGGGRCYHCDGTGLARSVWEPTGIA